MLRRASPAERNPTLSQKTRRDRPPANGAQTLLILPDTNFSGPKKATVEVNTVKCVAGCELLSAAPNP